ncbi:MAG: hypothetical protein RLZZ293_1548 [Pseudomonadota bacterium]|jgi:uncharacterized phage infection (PIP) family protein YhgE
MRKFMLICLIGAGITVSGYFAYNHYRDHQLANQVYQQLTILDQQLNSLNLKAQQLHQQQSDTDKFKQALKNLQANNLASQLPQLRLQLANLNYLPSAQTQLESIISQMNKQNFASSYHAIMLQTKLLVAYTNTSNQQFSQQIEQINQQLVQIKHQSKQIHSTNLQQLELARLSFINHKLTETLNAWHETLLNEIVDEIITKVQHSTSSKPLGN